MTDRKLMRKQLDRAFAEWKSLILNQERPKVGWVRTIRKALGMASRQLAKRLGVERTRITQLESAEQHDAVTLSTLKAVARAMDCEFIYAIVPKTSLEDILETRAKQIAIKRMKHVAHTMLLEAQSVSKAQQQEQLEELTKRLLEESPKKLWEE